MGYPCLTRGERDGGRDNAAGDAGLAAIQNELGSKPGGEEEGEKKIILLGGGEERERAENMGVRLD